MSLNSRMELETYKGHTLIFNGKTFEATVEGEKITKPSLAALKTAIDKLVAGAKPPVAILWWGTERALLTKEIKNRSTRYRLRRKYRTEDGGEIECHPYNPPFLDTPEAREVRADIERRRKEKYDRQRAEDKAFEEEEKMLLATLPRFDLDYFGPKP